MKRLSAALVGLVFIVSGVLKLMDPVGAGLSVEAYLQLFGWQALLPLAKTAAVLLSAFEASVGVCLLTGVHPAISRCAAALTLAGFSLMLAAVIRTGADMSCGCFGEAIPMNSRESLVKNAILMALLLFSSGGGNGRKLRRTSLALETAVLVFGVVSLFTLPVVDFTPLRKGSTVELEDIPLDGPVAIMSFYTEDFSRLEGFRSEAVGEGRRPIVLSVYPLEGAQTADRRFIMTLNRRNGGVTLLDDGLIVNKRP